MAGRKPKPFVLLPASPAGPTILHARKEEPITWAESIARWSAYLDACGLSAKTVRTYRRTVGNFLMDTLLDLHSVTEDDVVSYVAALPRNGAMRGVVLRALRSYYAWAEDKGLCMNPTRRLKPKNPKYGPAPDLSNEQLAKLLRALEDREPRRAWVILLAYETGARISSLCALEPRDVGRGTILFRVTKGNRPYSVPLNPAAQEAADNLVALGRETLVGCGPTRVRQWLEEAGRESGVRCWPHLLRHAFGTRIGRVTDPGTWADLMNHSDLSQYRRYVSVDDKRKQAAVLTGLDFST
jgi:integrase/recombinase XerD